MKVAYEVVCEREILASHVSNFKRDWINHRRWNFQSYKHGGYCYIYMEGEEDDRIEVGVKAFAARHKGTYRKLESSEQRVQRMHAGTMPLREALKWSSQRPHEVPLVNGEFEFITMSTPEVCDD